MPEFTVSSKRAISVELSVAPSEIMRRMAIFLFAGVREEMAHVIAYEAGDHGIGDDDQPTCYSRKLDELFEALGL